MANTRADITSINLENGALNLFNVESQIYPYEGFQEKNSLYAGGTLRNWHKKIISVDDSANIIQKWGGKYVWYQKVKDSGQNDMASVYIGDMPAGAFLLGYFDVSDADWMAYDGDFAVRIISNGIQIKYKDTLSKVGSSSCNSVSVMKEPSGSYLFTIYGLTGYGTFRFNTADKSISSVSGGTVVLSGYARQASELPVGLPESVYRRYDCVSLTHDSADKHSFIYGSDGKRELEHTLYGGKGWSKGRKVPTVAGFSVLYYNFEQYAVSYNNSVVVNNISRVLMTNPDGIYFEDSEGKTKYVCVKNDGKLHCQHILKDRYLCINTVSYENTIDLQTGKVFPRSDDYNDRANVKTADDESVYYVGTGWNEQAETTQEVYFASVFPPQAHKGHEISEVWAYIPGDVPDHYINIYSAEIAGGTPIYQKSYNVTTGDSYTDYSLSGKSFPQGEVLYNTATTAEFIDAYLNYCLVNEGGYSFLTQIDQYQNMIFGYNILTYIQLSNLFVIQGTIYGINNQYISSISIENSSISGSSVVCNKQDMEFIGATPQAALFYSPMDKSIYMFTGDQNIQKAYDCNIINTIYSFYNNPATGFILLSTDAGILGIYNDQIFSLDSDFKGYIYYTDSAYVIGNTEYSLYKKDGFEKVPVILETKFYGAGNETKSVNDCVYLRIYNENDEANGRIKIWCETLNEKTAKSDEKIFQITKDMFDEETKSIFIRYQPKYQEATGFKVHIESDFSICTLSISHKAETVQNAKYNL